ncbi:hypothetical protein D3C76_1600520 [compost metagenome]
MGRTSLAAMGWTTKTSDADVKMATANKAGVIASVLRRAVVMVESVIRDPLASARSNDPPPVQQV